MPHIGFTCWGLIIKVINMHESEIEIMNNLLNECMPYLTSAKTGAYLTKHLKDNAPILQKKISNILKAYSETINQIIQRRQNA